MDCGYLFDGVMDAANQLSADTVQDSLDTLICGEMGSMFSRNHSKAIHNEIKDLDYSLNSPLIADKVNALKDFLNTNELSPRFQRNGEVKIAYKMFKMVRSDWSGVSTDDGFYSWFFKCNKSLSSFIFNRSHSFVRFLMDDLHTETAVISKILDLFISQLTKQVSAKERFSQKKKEFLLSLTDRLRYPHLFKNCEMFLFLHFLVLWINSGTRREREELIRRERLEVLEFFYADKDDLETRENTDKFYVHVHHPSYGDLVLTKGFVWIVSADRLLDRNMLLMMKDLYAARFCSELSSRWEGINQKSDDSTHVILSAYELIDNCFIQFDNSAFKIVKLLEPLCTGRLAQLAEIHMPSVPKFTKFQDHLDRSIHELTRTLNSLLPVRVQQMISQLKTPESVAQLFGCFRHWGHPFLDYIAGLKKLHRQTTMDKEIDVQYTKRLASLLAKMILVRRWEETRVWNIDLSKLPQEHLLRDVFAKNLFPNSLLIDQFGENWHTLPILPLFEIPETIDPSEMLDDKSHSITRSELRAHVAKKDSTPAPSHRVLMTALNKEELNPYEFLHKVCKEGFPKDQLILGLKGKEREINSHGRYFCLMSEQVRDYFVLTEKLIKDHFFSYFTSITMADSQLEVKKKIFSYISTHGEVNSNSLSIANHADYEKWNNHQRYESTFEVFRVMGLFFGLPNLFTLTHEIFQKSWIYYGDRADLITFNGDMILSPPDQLVAWNGQAGGLEGLRQKGWCLNNLLMIELESKNRNTKVNALAQGDNQVIITRYQIPERITSRAYIARAKQVVANNKAIMDGIVEGAKKIGLLVNEDETVQSAGLLIYGKEIYYFGNQLSCTLKKYSRGLCLSNDQLPTLGNFLSTVNTTCLATMQQSDSITRVLLPWMLLGYFSIKILQVHSPILEGPLLGNEKLERDSDKMTLFYTKLMIQESAVGGVGGMPLTRFFIRQFPDPLTESLSFFKFIHDASLDTTIRSLMCQLGSPLVKLASEKEWTRLLESPTAINLPGNASAMTLVRNEVRRGLINNANSYKNVHLKESFKYLDQNRQLLISFLRGIRPVFPRFLSEFLAGTFIGYVESIVGLFQNSRTIRKACKRQFIDELTLRVQEGEYQALTEALRPIPSRAEIWTCSASHADLLRSKSWGVKIVGTTVPHPLELLGRVTKGTSFCIKCLEDPWTGCCLTTKFISPPTVEKSEKGCLSVYLGSVTQDSTSLLKPWEKPSKVPVIRRALDLRQTEGWFVKRDGLLASSIYNNVESLTGRYDLKLGGEFSRTGCALHRFSSSRYSNGGFCASSHNLLTYCFTTTDTLQGLTSGGRNWDFMFQSLLLWCQGVCIELWMESGVYSAQYHFHIACKNCVRPIEEVTLEANHIYNPIGLPISSWIKKRQKDSFEVRKVEGRVPLGDWKSVEVREKSFHIGVTQGFLFGMCQLFHTYKEEEINIFPISIYNHLTPKDHLMGILKGILMVATLDSMCNRKFFQGKHHTTALRGTGFYILLLLSSNPNFISLIKSRNYSTYLYRLPHQPVPSYPATVIHTGRIVMAHLSQKMTENAYCAQEYGLWGSRLWMFSDLTRVKDILLFGLAQRCYKVSIRLILGSKDRANLKRYRTVLSQILIIDRETGSVEEELSNLKSESDLLPGNLRLCNQEVRHACSDLAPVVVPEINPISETRYEFDDPTWDGISIIIPHFRHERPKLPIPPPPCQMTNPTISGLRLLHLNTGAFMKIKEILPVVQFTTGDVLCGGDGSGGISSLILRRFPASRVIFNSMLCDIEERVYGVSPEAPSAITELDEDCQNRCVNLFSSWENPTDLRRKETWDYFYVLVMGRKLNLRLIIMDMEATEVQSHCVIFEHLLKFLVRLRLHRVTIIFKIYISMIYNPEYTVLNQAGKFFKKVKIVKTIWTSSHSSEMYLICEQFTHSPQIDCYISLYSLRQLWNDSYCQCESESEFQRAKNLPVKELFLSIPERWIPHWKPRLIGLLDKSGMSLPIAYRVVEAFSVCRDQGVNIPAGYLHGLISLAWNQIIPISNYSKTPFGAPSLSRSIRCFSMMVGIYIVLSLQSSRSDKYSSIINWINSGVFIYFETSPIHLSVLHPLYWKVEWSFKTVLGRNLDLTNGFESAWAAEWIRCLYTYGQGKLFVNRTEAGFIQEDHDSLVTPFIKRLSWLDRGKKSGAYEIADWFTNGELWPIIEIRKLLKKSRPDDDSENENYQFKL